MSAAAKLEHWHEACYACKGSGGYYPTTAQHDDCVGTCGGGPSWKKAPADACTEPCRCSCREPLTRNEIMEIRDLLGKFRR